MKSTFTKITTGIAAMLLFSTASAQLTVASGTPAQLVDTMLGTGVTASGITYSGYPFATGTFNGALSNIGFNSGAFLCTGDINMAPGPNSSGSMSLGGSMVMCTDPQLNAIATTTLYDAAVLEFDFVPTSDTIKFRYVFGSEEYPEFVCSNFNDVFGFFISGPNPAGGSYSNVNIAIIPGSGGLPVAINTVNPGVAGSAGTPGGCTSLAYSSYYFDNLTPPGATVQFDGFTVPLTAIANVICGATYHIKLAIADAGDGAWDSGVFLEEGSFSSQGVQIIPEISYGSPDDSTLYEGCGLACIYFVRTSNLANADTVNLTISGSAVNGVDYNTGVVGIPLPSTLIFAPGQDSISYCINAVADGLLEGLDTINLSISLGGPCGGTVTTATIYLDELDSLAVTTSGDTAICGSGTATITGLVTGGVEPYTYSWSGGAGSSSTVNVSPGGTTTYYLTVSDACTNTVDPTPNVSDSVVVVINPAPVMMINAAAAAVNDSTLFEGCVPACFYFIRTSPLTVADTFNITIGGTATNGTDYTVSPGSTSLPNQIIFPVGVDSVQYCISAGIDGIEGIETILLNVIQGTICPQPISIANLYIQDVTPLTIVTTGDTLFCSGGGTASFSVVATGGLQPYSYSWTGGLPSTSSPSPTVSSSTTYYVTVNDACSSSTPAVTDSVMVGVASYPPMVATAGSDMLVCPGDLIMLNAGVTGGGSPYTYSWTTVAGTDSVSNPGVASTSVVANGPGVYLVTIIDTCGNVTTDQVAIDVETSCILNIPNIITPDGTGPAVNGFFFIENLEKFPGSSVAIYNRWGNKIYESDNYQNNWNGGGMNDGVYYYVLTVPASGKVMAQAHPSPSYKASEDSDKKVFAGFFHVTR